MSGGIGAVLTNGNFWQGATIGFTVSLLNHVAHNDKPKPKKSINKKLVVDGIVDTSFAVAEIGTGITITAGSEGTMSFVGVPVMLKGFSDFSFGLIEISAGFSGQEDAYGGMFEALDKGAFKGSGTVGQLLDIGTAPQKGASSLEIGKYVYDVSQSNLGQMLINPQHISTPHPNFMQPDATHVAHPIPPNFLRR